jgi:hypothetical protein
MTPKAQLWADEQNYLDELFSVIVYSNENSETHIIQERRAAEAPSLAGDGVLQGR